MRIALITPGGLGPTAGGGGIPVITRLAEMLAEDHCVTAFSLSRVEQPPELNIWHPDTQSVTRSSVLQALRALINEGRRTPFDVIHGFWSFPAGALAVMAAKLTGARSVVTLQGAETAAVPEIGYGDLLNRYHTMRSRLTCRAANAVVLLSHLQERAFHKAGFRARHIEVIPWGVPDSVFRYAPSVLSEPLQFVHVANLTEVKNQARMLRVFGQIAARRPAELTIVGPDHMQGRLQAITRELGLTDRVRFTGYLPQPAVAEAYRKAHFLLHTAYWESQGVAAIEAAMSGAVPCGTPTGCMADRDDACVTSDDDDELIEAILDVADDQTAYRAMLDTGRATAAAQDSTWNAATYVALYSRLLAAA